MANQRLTSAMAGRDMSITDMAAVVGCDPKTVRRWLSGERVPHLGARMKVARCLEVDESYLWPPSAEEQPVGHTEIVQVYATRSAVPEEVWRSITSATRQLDVLVYSGGFLIEAFGLPRELARLSAVGGRGRVLLGDPSGDEVAERAVAEGLPSLTSRAQSSHEYLARAARLPGIELRTHNTPLYVSIYRGDDLMAVNQHTHGLPAMDNPVLLLRKVPGEALFTYYEQAYERVWAEGK